MQVIKVEGEPTEIEEAKEAGTLIGQVSPALTAELGYDQAATPPAPTEDSSVAAQMVQQRLRELLSKHLSVDVLQGVLARAHQKDGSLAAASDDLLAQLLPALEIPTTSQVLQMSIKDPGGLPTRTMQTDLPQDGESLPREA
eukprot:s12_g4.t1